MVASPIGNLQDISLRALETLKAVSIVACEDTRRTLKLLTRFGIKARLVSCRAANERLAAAKLVRELDGGLDIAYLSDAGSPALSDPGAILARLAAEGGHKVVPLPGPSAFASLVSVAGGTGKTLVFEGFLSPKGGRRRSRLKELLALGSAFVLYESPFRIVKLLTDLAEFDGERYVCVGREMTKIHEEYVRGSAASVLRVLENRAEQKGEFSIFVSGPGAEKRTMVKTSEHRCESVWNGENNKGESA
ncbi:MAG: 16S rRNA (cytidine(1402)-2'-O)-methyltransferase [Spirochaetaceae bacterium]|jgi:16S rRNA (cytidine1402-2'-O)-methyltransferase|nr:16S rRNA (cytidine(1402)-2'-O)-methyltransferase [Spirochaetaceae bacterium]